MFFPKPLLKLDHFTWNSMNRLEKVYKYDKKQATLNL